MERNYLVTKSNKLIYGHFDLTLTQQKLIITLSSMVQPKDMEFKEYTLKIKDFMHLLGITDQSKYKEVPKITKDLMKKVLEIQEGNDILQLSWLASARYKKHEGEVVLKFAPDLKPYLLQIKEFYTSYKLSNILDLKSKYSIRLYEILKSNQYKKQKFFEISLMELKKMLGADTSAYNLYANFKNRILNPSNEELKEKTDIYFEYDEIKEGRKVVKLKFYIYLKNEIAATATFSDEDILNDNIKLVCNICENQINEKEAKIILKDANDDIGLIKEKYDIVKELDNCRNIPGAMRDAIRDNWVNKKSKKRPGGTFNNYTQRKYNAKELEKKILGQDYDEGSLYAE